MGWGVFFARDRLLPFASGHIVRLAQGGGSILWWLNEEEWVDDWKDLAESIDSEPRAEVPGHWGGGSFSREIACFLFPVA
jgi:hypothetical protein